MKVILASEAGLNRLYHYQPFDKKRVRPILTKSRLYMSVPKDFNDPWDCRPCFDPTGLTDPTIREQHIQFLVRADRRQQPKSEAEHVRNERRLREEPGFLEWLMDQTGGNGIGPEIDKRYRVYCLATRSDIALMWSHYARNHSGICLEFAVDNPVMCGAYQVQYCESYPSMALAGGPVEEVLIPLITKSDDWQRENEYRVIAQEKSAAVGGPTLLTENNFLQFAPEILKAVIVGCRMQKADRDVIQGWVNAIGGRIELKEAVQIPNRYEIRIQPLV
jgi:hypothetical protein